MPTATRPTNHLPPTCNVKGWVVFGPGPHKDGKDYYSPAMCERIVSNFARLKGHTVPQAKIGHDRNQVVADRLKKSLGFPSVGHVSAVRSVPGFPGAVEVDVVNVPTRGVGGLISAGRINSGSVELIPHVLDPEDPSRRIEGPILTGVSFLGEEQPAVRNFPPELRQRAIPRATFDDGTPVPPEHELSPEWLEAMSDAHLSLMSDRHAATVTVGGREYAASVICFSDLSPLPSARTSTMNPEIQAALDALAAKGITPDQVAAAVGVGPSIPAPEAPTAMGDATPAPGAMPTSVTTMSKDESGGYSAAFAEQCKKFADDPAATPEQKMMAAMYAEMADMKKRFGAVEAKAEEVQKKDEAAKMAAFSAQVDAECAKLVKKVEPKVLNNVVRPTALNILTAKSFSSEGDRVKAFGDYFAGFAALPDSPLLAQQIATSKPAGKPGARVLTPLQQQMTRKGGLLDRENPRASAALRAAASAN